MTFNRQAAITYARRHWNRPCDDGLFWTNNAPVYINDQRKQLGASAKEGWDAVFAPYVVGQDEHGNPRFAEEAVFQRSQGGSLQGLVIQEWAGLVDCAHFLSRCLQSGGINVNFTSVPKLVQALQQRSDTKMLAEKVTRAQGQRVVDSGVFKKGDMIGYFNSDPTDTYHRNQYNHSAMYAGKDSDPKGGITCHTVCRFSGENFPAGSPIDHFPDSWFLHDGPRYTLIHFSQDDPPLHGDVRNSLPGWWKVECGGSTVYYQISGDGRAQSSRKAPRSRTDWLYAAGDSAYYFQQFPQMVFTWRKGNVDVWRLAGSGKQCGIITLVQISS